MDPVDAFSTVQKQIRMLELDPALPPERAQRIVKRGAPISADPQPARGGMNLIRMKTQVPNEQLDRLDEICSRIDEQMGQLETEYK